MASKRRQHSAEFKFRVALEAAKGQRTISELSNAYSVHPNQISQWKRQLLDDVRRIVGRGALIPCNKNYVQQLRTYERNTVKAGLDRNHGLRHAYAQRRYEAITGWACPAVGGPDRKTLTPAQREQDRNARETVSGELGHARQSVVAIYLG